MSHNSDMKKILKRVFFNLKDALIKEGFTTTWKDPFFCWIHNEPISTEDEPEETPRKFYVTNPPVPKISPFDLAVVEIYVDISQHIYFNLCLYYCSVMEGKVEHEDINTLYEEHNQKWLIANMEYFGNIAGKYGLEWDVEYDDCICDSLWRSFPAEEAYKVVQIMKELEREKRRYDAANKDVK